MIARDKIMHFLVGYAIALIVSVWLYMFIGTTVATLLGVTAGVLAGVAKEVYDEYRVNGTGFDWYDILATSLGAVAWFATYTIEVIHVC